MNTLKKQSATPPPLSSLTQIPKGFCQCGCSEKTNISKFTYKPKGWIKGEPRSFVAGHSQRKIRLHKSVIVTVDGVKCRTIPLTKGASAIVDTEDYKTLSDRMWYVTCIKDKFYAASYDRTSRKRIWLHKVIISAPNGLEPDHINGNSLDNRRCNLRPATSADNRHNTPKRDGCTSCYLGVSWSGGYHQKWMVTIRPYGVYKFLGRFDSEEEAARVWDRAARKYYGEFARLNFPEDFK